MLVRDRACRRLHRRVMPVQGEHHREHRGDRQYRQRDRRTQRETQQPSLPASTRTLDGFLERRQDLVENRGVAQHLDRMPEPFVQKRVDLLAGRPTTTLADRAELGCHAA